MFVRSVDAGVGRPAPEVRPKSGAQIGSGAPSLRDRSGGSAAGACGPTGRTRRAALSTILRGGGLATIAAGLLGTTTAEASTPASLPQLARVVNFEALTAESLRLAALCHESQTEAGAASRALRRQIGEETFRVVMTYVEGRTTISATSSTI